MAAQRKILTRARRLYVAVCRLAIDEDLSGQVLDRCAGRMLDAGMYAKGLSRKNDLQSIRYSILRQMWRRESVAGARHGRTPSWHEWTFKHGWIAHSWRRMLQREAA
jgi:hypothetical protein